MRARAHSRGAVLRASCVIYITSIGSRNRITNFLASVTRILSSRARCRRRFHETRRDRVALPRGTGTPHVDTHGGGIFARKLPRDWEVRNAKDGLRLSRYISHQECITVRSYEEAKHSAARAAKLLRKRKDNRKWKLESESRYTTDQDRSPPRRDNLALPATGSEAR